MRTFSNNKRKNNFKVPPVSSRESLKSKHLIKSRN